VSPIGPHSSVQPGEQRIGWYGVTGRNPYLIWTVSNTVPWTRPLPGRRLLRAESRFNASLPWNGDHDPS